MKTYLDASVLVAIFTPDPFAANAIDLLGKAAGPLAISDFGRAEFSATVARKVRDRLVDPTHAQAIFARFDLWAVRSAELVVSEPADMLAAEALVRQPDLILRAPDALHIAIAMRVGGALATFDKGQARAANASGLTVIT